MTEALIGGLVGAVVALLGTLLGIRDTKRGRESASEEKAAATLLKQLSRVRANPKFLEDHRAAEDFEEECLAAVLAFRDPKVRDRLTRSTHIITHARRWAWTSDTKVLVPEAYRIASRDIRRCLEARLDGKRLPAPAPDWISADDNLSGFLEKLADDLDAAERAADAEREEFLDRETNPL